jgi:hypothetical protein
MGLAPARKKSSFKLELKGFIPLGKQKEVGKGRLNINSKGKLKVAYLKKGPKRGALELLLRQAVRSC